MKSRTTNHEGLLYRALLGIGLSVLGLLIVSCSPSQSIALVQTSTATLIPTATATPTNTPTPTPAPIAGIDEPIVVKNISVKQVMGGTQRGDLELRILKAYTEESLKSGDTTIYPDRPGYVFLTLELELKGPGNSLSWVSTNAHLIYDGETRVASRNGVRFGNEGRLEAWLVIFTVPKDSQFGRYVFQLPDGQTIKLSSFFQAD